MQTHTRSVHPATCPYPSCKGKLFSQQKGLRAHIRIHEQREAEDTLLSKSHRLDDNEEEDYPVKRRRGGEVGRDWRCTENGCEKDFKSVSIREFLLACVVNLSFPPEKGTGSTRESVSFEKT